MTDPIKSKAALRKTSFEARKVAYENDTGAGAGLLSSVLAGYRGVPLAGYMPIRTELNPLPAMEEAAAHGLVGVPVIVSEGLPLRFAEWAPDEEMIEGAFGARIPALPRYFEPQIVVVPLVAFDRSGGRLGYGGGFYDRTLEKLRGIRATLAIGFAYDAQETDAVPLEPTDQPLDMIVTESRVLDFR